MTKHSALLQQFTDAVLRLEEALKEKKSDLVRDSEVKRFEMAFDLSWKTIKAFLEIQGVFCASPAGCFREAFRQGMIDFEDTWMKMVATRNKTVHTYDAKLAEEVYRELPQALSAFQKLITLLKERCLKD